MARILTASLYATLDRLAQAVAYRWRRLASAMVASRFAQSTGHVFLGRDCVIKGHRHIYLSGRFVALARNRIEAIERHGEQRFNPVLKIGDAVTMEYDCHIGCVQHVEIGDRVLLASRVYISDHSHGGTTQADIALPPNHRMVVSKGPVVIEDEVWLGEGVAVMPNVRIGRSSIIGANSVVTRDIPPYSIAVGSPARVIRTISSPSGDNSISA